MKRYWKLVAITGIIVLTIGTLYIQTSLAANSYPEFVIEHKEGNKEEVKPLTIIGDYEADEASYIHTEISDEGTAYEKFRSTNLFFLWENYLNPEIKRLQKDYRNFMRGKHEQINLFFEDQNAIAYVELKSGYLYTNDHQWSYSFEIDILDKKSENKTTFEIEVPEGERYAFLRIQGVQLFGDELKIITVNELNPNDKEMYNEEMHIYTIDTKTQKFMDDKIIDFELTEITPNLSIGIDTVNNGADIGFNRHFVFTLDVWKEIATEEYYDYEWIERQLIAYDLETDEQTIIDLTEELGEEIYPELLQGEIIYFTKENETQLDIISYNLDSQEIETNQTFDLVNNDGNYLRYFTLDNGKIYIVHQLDEGKIDSMIMIGDALTGEILYEGSIKLADSSKGQQENKMHISQINVKKE